MSPETRCKLRSLRSRCWAVAAVWFAHAQDGRRAKLASIAEETGLSMATVKRALADLRTAGVIGAHR